jgi:hypothetical protein
MRQRAARLHRIVHDKGSLRPRGEMHELERNDDVDTTESTDVAARRSLARFSRTLAAWEKRNSLPLDQEPAP